MKTETSTVDRVTDRRSRPTSAWDAFRWGGRRRRARRGTEQTREYFVDQFGAWLFVGVIALFLMTLADGILTINLMDVDCQELNPFMDWLISRGQGTFLFGKYLLTALGVPFLIVFKNHYLFKSRLRIGYLIPMFVAVYGLLLSYQLYLAHHLLFA